MVSARSDGNVKYNFVDPENPEVHTQTIESAWQKFKQANRKRYGTKRDLFMLFLVEHMWRKKFAGRDALFNFWTHVRETYKPVEGELEYRQTFDKEYDHDVFDDM
ncbi:hypothetical protein DdX_19398 [Ditylenchus destructor]|uniref:Uncharacterized protein n=1 Tax=Ditylenchus destructor TaxID=166010 RepID=A0AAD4QXF5_9BILA|nr:hypothetical protein DdX_19398 [Ditylenchus destructor]